jgi:hypothetical protein
MHRLSEAGIERRLIAACDLGIGDALDTIVNDSGVCVEVITELLYMSPSVQRGQLDEIHIKRTTTSASQCQHQCQGNRIGKRCDGR